MKKFNTILAVALLLFSYFRAEARIWRVNNNSGITADFTSLDAAVISASVQDGDTLHLESSANTYGDATINKRLVIIGTGYFLDPANVTFPPNTGLQYKQQTSMVRFINLVAGSAGTKFIGISLVNGNTAGSIWTNITFEKCYIGQPLSVPNAANSGLVVRKCFVDNNAIVCTLGSLTDFTCENTIFFGFWAGVNMPNLSGTNNIFRNNTFSLPAPTANSTIANCYVANNIFANNNGTPVTFSNCNIKNNLFSQNQSLPGTAVSNLINVNMNDVYTGGSTGSWDSRYALKAGSPAIGAGVTVGTVVSPDCGAFGGTDPYKLSGIPNIPTIYSLTAPTSIPSGTSTMNVTFSTRNNN
jgi:hypothetical protein